MGASAFLKSVDFRAFAVNVKTIAPTQKLYQSGHAIWWGEAPRIVSTFMESYDFSGKTIVPFCTSGGSGIGSSDSNLEQLTSGADWLEGRRLNGSDSEETVMEWVNGLDNLLNIRWYGSLMKGKYSLLRIFRTSD